MATSDKILNGAGLSALSSQIKSYVNDKTEISVGETAPTDTKIKLWVDTSSEGSIEWDDIANKPDIPSIEGLAKTADLAKVATSGSYNDLSDKPESYTLPVATSSTLGGVKVDGSTITITEDGVISSTGSSGGSEPDKYIKDASVSGNTLTLTKEDDSTITFSPTGGSSGGGVSYSLNVGDSYTADDITHIEEVKADRNIPMTIDNLPVIGFRQIDIGNNTILYYVMTDDTDPLLYREYQYKQGLKIQVANYVSKSIKRLNWNGVSTNNDLPNWFMDWVKNPNQFIVLTDSGIVVYASKNQFQSPPYITFTIMEWNTGVGQPQVRKWNNVYFTDYNMTTYHATKAPVKGTTDIILTASNYSDYIK